MKVPHIVDAISRTVLEKLPRARVVACYPANGWGAQLEIHYRGNKYSHDFTDGCTEKFLQWLDGTVGWLHRIDHNIGEEVEGIGDS